MSVGTNQLTCLSTENVHTILEHAYYFGDQGAMPQGIGCVQDIKFDCSIRVFLILFYKH